MGLDEAVVVALQLVAALLGEVPVALELQVVVHVTRGHEPDPRPVAAGVAAAVLVDEEALELGVEVVDDALAAPDRGRERDRAVVERAGPEARARAPARQGPRRGVDRPPRRRRVERVFPGAAERGDRQRVLGASVRDRREPGEREQRGGPAAGEEAHERGTTVHARALGRVSSGRESYPLLPHARVTGSPRGGTGTAPPPGSRLGSTRGGTAAGGTGSRGSDTRNVVPRPGALSTSIRPPWFVTMLWTTARPSPVPSPTGF